jgi:hypothetical protein
MRHYDLAPVAEVAMNPRAYAQSMEQAGGRKVLVGLEFEVLVPKDVVLKNQSGVSAGPVWPEVIEDVAWADGIDMDYLSINNSDEFQTINSLVTTRGGARLPTAYKKWNQEKFKSAVDPLVAAVFNKITNPVVHTAVVEAYQTLMQAWQRSRTVNYEYLEYKDIVEEVLVKVKAKIISSIPATAPEEKLAVRQAAHEIGHLAVKVGNLYNYMQIGTHYQNFYNDLAGTPVRSLGDLLRSGAVKFDMRALASPANRQNLVGLWYAARGQTPTHRQRSSSASGIDQQTRVFLQSQLAPMFGDVIVFNSYHEKRKNTTSWYVEPDGSLRPNLGDGSAEVVSPPLPANEAIEAIKNFYRLAIRNDFYTNDSTGLHINVSIPQRTDLLKLMMFLGDEYVLKTFNRLDNDYAQSIVKSTIKALRDEHDSLPRPGDEFDEIVNDTINDLAAEHMSSVNYNGKYFSFRQAGGDYLNNLRAVLDTVGRFVRALIIASSPDQHRKDYLSKLYKLREKGADEKPPVSDIEQAREQIRQLKAEGASVARTYFFKFGEGTVKGFKESIQLRYSNYSISWAPATEDDVKKFIGKGHGLSSNTKAMAQADPQNLFVGTAIGIGANPRKYSDLTDGQAGSFDAPNGWTRIGVYWGLPAGRIEPGTPEIQQLIKQIIKNISKTKR